MNRYVAFAVGAAIGAGVGYVVAHLMIERYRSLEGESNVDFGNEPDDAVVTVVRYSGKPPHPVEYTEFYKQGPAAEKPDLAALAKRYNEEVMADTEAALFEPEEVDLNEESTNNNQTGPFQIKMEEYVANPWKHRKTTLTYYTQDDVVAANGRTPVPNHEDLIGAETLSLFDDSGTLYICNPRLECLYVVNRVDGLFYKERDIQTKRRKPPKDEESS